MKTDDRYIDLAPPARGYAKAGDSGSIVVATLASTDTARVTGQDYIDFGSPAVTGQVVYQGYPLPAAPMVFGLDAMQFSLIAALFILRIFDRRKGNK